MNRTYEEPQSTKGKKNARVKTVKYAQENKALIDAAKAACELFERFLLLRGCKEHEDLKKALKTD